ncbi:hypothetical protein HII17_06790 [Thalassotalea sp. M1531]|uniref:Uncharacterized protein n=1 Tax=Thalassotalea algicola TaxID=2716224 RepID=A0A7Y0Q6W9_9GAMM|nr:hypothetical protein [Thalassotalea algicola]NMP31262.1 hypothetical protein [Thalassotalea algicola]
MLRLVFVFVAGLVVQPLIVGAKGFNFPDNICTSDVCDENGDCTKVNQCLYLDATAEHCQVSVNNIQVSCADIQSRKQLTATGQCQDLGVGTLDSPWCTVAQAASYATAGSLVLIAPGKYLTPGGTHGLHDFNSEGTEVAPIVFRNATFDPSKPSIPQEEVVITPFTSVSGWAQLDAGEDYLICEHNGLVNDSTTFNGISTNIKSLGNDKPFMKLFSEQCGTRTNADALNYLKDLSWLPKTRKNDQGYFVQVWNEGIIKGSSNCPALNSSEGGSTVVRVNKTENVQHCSDLSLQTTGVGHTVHLQSTGDICGDLEEILSRQGLDSADVSYTDDEADHIRFEGLTIDAANYGLTIETDHIDLFYSKIQGSYKDAVKAIGNEAWDHRRPNHCSRAEVSPVLGEPAAELQDLINYCKGISGGSLLVGDLISPPSCTGSTLDTFSLEPDYFYWDLPLEQGKAAMLAARDSQSDEYCVGNECVTQTSGTFSKYCNEVVPTFKVEENGTAKTIPDNCNDFYYFNAENVNLLHNEIRYFGEDAIDITGGDYWKVFGNTIHSSIITHGASQMPSGVLTKNHSTGNSIEENLFFNIHHSITGIISLGGAPSEKGSASDALAMNNVMISVSGNNILHVPSCDGCLVAHNLMMDVTIGEEGSRSRGFIHVGGNRKSCLSANGDKIDCSTEKRGAAYQGKGNSIVNNVVELIKWRDTDSYRLLSFGGFKSDEQLGYVYNGDNELCVSSNNISAGAGITSVTTHVTDSEVKNLACKITSSQQSKPIVFQNVRINECVNNQKVNQAGINENSLYECLQYSSEEISGNPVILKATSIFNDIGFDYNNADIKLVGSCSDSGSNCTKDSQCSAGFCAIEPSYIERCKLGPLNSISSPDPVCRDLLEAPLSPNNYTGNAYPEFTWRNVENDLEYQFLLYRFHPDGGVNDAAWSELLSYDNIKLTQCNQSGICSHRAKNLLTDGTYTWKLKRRANSGWGSWSTTQVFSVLEPDRKGHTLSLPTGQIYPKHGEHVGSDPKLNWQYDPYANAYSILFYRYTGSYELMVNLKLNSDQLACDYQTGCKILVSKLLSLMNSDESELTSGTYTWKTKKWTNGEASSWNNPTSVLYVD